MHNEKRFRSRDGATFGAAGLGLLVAGTAVGIYAIRRPKLALGLSSAAGLIVMKRSRAALQPSKLDASASFVINASPAEAYNFWRRLENLPLFMKHLQSVKLLDGTRSEWVALGPMETPIRWTATIEYERPNERISWRSTPDSDFETDGSVEFRPMAGDRGTMVKVHFRYEMPAGKLGKAAFSIFGKNPEWTIREDLRRFKALMEMGEIPTTDGQPHGPRSTIVSAIDKLYGHTPKRSEKAAGGEVPAQRRAS